MLVLFLSLSALSVGAIVTHLARHRPHLLAGLDGFVVATIVGIVTIHVVPHSMAELGGVTVVPLVFGLLLPSWAEGMKARAPRDGLLAAVVVIGLSVHALLDGTALNMHEGHAHGSHDRILATAVALHRVPEGLAVWWLVFPRRGPRWAAAALVAIGGASIAGYFLSEALVDCLPERALIALEALVAGSLLHVVAHHELSAPGSHAAHRHGAAHLHEARGLSSGIGALIGCAFLLLVTRDHPIVQRASTELGFGETVRALSMSMAPALLLALFASCVLHSLNLAGVRHLGAPRAVGRFGSAARGVLLGMFLPVCSCGVRPLYRRRAGREPDAETTALLVSAPEMELASVLLTATLISPVFAVSRIALMLVIGVLGGGLLGGAITRASGGSTGGTRSIQRGIRFALGETVDHTGPWIVFGVVVASLVEPFVERGSFDSVPVAALVLGFAIVGSLLPMCAAGITPLLAVLVHKGLPPGAALSFVAAAAATNIRTLTLLRERHGARAAIRHLATTLTLVVVGGLAVHGLGLVDLDTPLHAVATGSESALARVCLLVLGLTMAVALLRRGPRALLLELFRDAGLEAKDHVSGPTATPKGGEP